MRGAYLTGHTPREHRWCATAHVEQTAVSHVRGRGGWAGGDQHGSAGWGEVDMRSQRGGRGSQGDGTCQSYPIRARPPPSMVARITFGQYLYKGGKGVSSFQTPLKAHSCPRRDRTVTLWALCYSTVTVRVVPL